MNKIIMKGSSSMENQRKNPNSPVELDTPLRQREYDAGTHGDPRAVRSLQSIHRMRHGLKLKKGVHYLISTNSCFSPRSPSTLHRMRESLESMKLKHSRSILEISRQPFLPMQKPIQCFPSTTMDAPAGSTFDNIRAHLQCIKCGERLSYTFTIEDNDDFFLIARAMRKADSSNTKGKNSDAWMYTFHHGSNKERIKKQGGKTEGRSEKPATDLELVGKMNVSSFVSCDATKSSVEFQFVLFNVAADDMESEAGSGNEKKKSQLLKSIMDTRNGLSLELAAFVIQVPSQEQEEEHQSGKHSNGSSGWGLKFLERDLDSRENNVPAGKRLDGMKEAFEDHIKRTPNTFPLNENARNGGTFSVDVNKDGYVIVILPSGNHGLPINRRGGPSPLIQRWKLGGKCDCGGWDLGCGLTILSTHMISSTMDDVKSSESSNPGVSINNPLQICYKATAGFRSACQSKSQLVNRQSLQAFSLQFVRKGLYSLTFLAQLSPLQAFAMAVAILHSRDPIHFSNVVMKQNRKFEKSKPHTLSKRSEALCKQNEYPILIQSPPKSLHETSTESSSYHPFGRS